MGTNRGSRTKNVLKWKIVDNLLKLKRKSQGMQTMEKRRNLNIASREVDPYQ